jgi:hypothetical protein
VRLHNVAVRVVRLNPTRHILPSILQYPINFGFKANLSIVYCIVVFFVQHPMSTKSKCQYGLSCLAHNQCDDLLLEFVNDLGIVTKCMDVMWHYLFGKPRSFGEHPYFDERVNV